jgi:hypothetical protein
MARRVRVRGPRDLEQLSPRSREAFLGSAEAVSDARRKRTTIAHEVERLQREGVRVSRYSVRRYFGHDLERGPGGFSVPTRSDRSYHGDLYVISTEGVVARPVRGSEARTLISEHANAVGQYLSGRDPDGEGLHRFRGRRVAGVELETDLDRLDLLRDAGELDDFELYAETTR